MRSDVSSGVPTGFVRRRALAVLLTLLPLLLATVDGRVRDEQAVVAGGVKRARAG